MSLEFLTKDFSMMFSDEIQISYVNISSLRHIMNTVLPAVGISKLHASVPVEVLYISEGSRRNCKII